MPTSTKSTVTDLRLRIGELAKQTGVSVGTLRYYETLTLVSPCERGDNGYRYYGAEAIEQVHFIKKAQSLGFSLDEVGQILAIHDRGKPPCDLVQTLLDQKIEHLGGQIKQMSLFKAELEEYRDRWATIPPATYADHDICPLVATVPLPDDDTD